MADILEVEARLRDFISGGLDKIEQKMKTTAGANEQMNRKAQQSEGVFHKLDGAVSKAAAAFGSFYIINTAVGWMNKFTNAADAQMMAQAQLENALGKSSAALSHQAGALQQVTRYGDEETMGAQARMAAYIKDDQMIKRLIPVVQDFASAKQMDLASATEIVTKSIVGEVNMLGRYGIQVTGAARTTERFDSVMKNLNDRFGGTAQTIGAAGAGPLVIFKNNLGDLGEEIGMVILPALSKMTEGLNNTIQGWRLLLGVTLNDPIKDLTIVNQKIGDIQEKIFKTSQSPTWDWLSEKIQSEEVRKMEQTLGKLQNERAKLQSAVNDIINPKKPTGGKSPFAGEPGTDGDAAKALKAEEARIEALLAGFDKLPDPYEIITESDALSTALIVNSQRQEEAMYALLESSRISAVEISDIEKMTTQIKEEETKKRVKLTHDEINARFDQGQSLMSYAQLTSDTIGMIAQANKTGAEDMKRIRIGQAWIDNAATQIGAARTIWAESGGTWQTKLGASIAVSSMLFAQLGAQIAMIEKQKFAVGTRSAPGGMAWVGEQGPELVNLPRGSRVYSALETRNIVNNSNVNNTGGNTVNVAVYDRTTGDSLLKMLHAGELDNFLMYAKRRGRF